MSYNGKSKRFKNALITLAAAVQYDNGGGAESAFAQVLGSTSEAFSGWPNVQVLPGDISVVQPTVSQVDKTPAYILRIRIPLEDTVQAQDATYDQMYDLTDLLIDAIDDADHAGSLTDGIGLISITMMNATRGDWVVNQSQSGATLVCDVNVTITYSQDLS